MPHEWPVDNGTQIDSKDGSNQIALPGPSQTSTYLRPLTNNRKKLTNFHKSRLESSLCLHLWNLNLHERSEKARREPRRWVYPHLTVGPVPAEE